MDLSRAAAAYSTEGATQEAQNAEKHTLASYCSMTS